MFYVLQLHSVRCKLHAQNIVQIMPWNQRIHRVTTATVWSVCLS